MKYKHTLFLAWSIARCSRAFVLPMEKQRLTIPQGLHYRTSERFFFSRIFEALMPGKSAEKVTKAEMKDILSRLDKTGRNKTKMVVIDVRSVAEVAETGSLSKSVITLPLNLIQGGAFTLSDDEFQRKFHFTKPQTDETIVFSCKSGMRAGAAADIAAAAGYDKIIVYPGSANEWFSD